MEASDNGTPPLKSDCVVTVTVKDKNDHPPIIELTAVYESENDSGKNLQKFKTSKIDQQMQYLTSYGTYGVTYVT